jgi:glycine/D-amino acid oxidase-like deaminating enzyme
MEPADGLAFIGINPGPDKNVFIATGDSGNGITHGTIAGLILSDQILGKIFVFLINVLYQHSCEGVPLPN